MKNSLPGIVGRLRPGAGRLEQGGGWQSVRLSETGLLWTELSGPSEPGMPDIRISIRILRGWRIPKCKS